MKKTCPDAVKAGPNERNSRGSSLRSWSLIPIIRPNTSTYNYIHMQIQYKYICIGIFPYYPAKYIHIQLRPHTNTTKYKCIHIGIHAYYPAKDIHMNSLYANTSRLEYISSLRPSTYIYILHK